MIKNIAIIGLGGTGGYYGGKLAYSLNSNNNRKVYFVARGKHLEEIQKNGLILNTVEEGSKVCVPTLATDNISDLPELDLCFICVKGFDLNKILEEIKPKIKPTTIVIPTLNGIDIHSRVKECLPAGIVLPACIYIGAYVEKPGTVTQNGGSCKIIFGQDPTTYINLSDLQELFQEAGIKYEYSEKVLSEIWEKFVFIAPYGLVTACFNKTIGEVLNSQELSSYVIDIIKEIVSLSEKIKIELSEGIVEKSFSKGKGFPYETKTSFQRDFENKNRPDERDIFGKSIIILCEKYSVKCETTKHIFNKLEKIKPISS